jgi:hypothetical protein
MLAEAVSSTTQESRRSAMPSLEARIETERPSRYLVQFCKHAAAMGSAGGHSSRMHLHGMMARREVQVDAEWSDTRGTVTFTPWGQCTLTADENILNLRIEAQDEEGVRQIQGVVTKDLDRFSRRNPLTVTWNQPLTSDTRPRAGWLRSNLQMIVHVVGGILVVALHLGLAGTLLSDAPWAGVATNVVLAVIALKVVLIVLGRLGFRHRKALKMRRNMGQGSS